MKLYSYFRSSTSYRVRMALNLKGVSYDVIPVNLVKGEQRDEAYLTQNPQGRVPTLIHGDFTLTQSMAIIEYLDDIAPEPPLVFGTGEHKAYIRQVAQAVSCDIHPVANLNVLKYLTGTLGVSEEQKTKWYADFASTGMAAVEKLLSARGWSGDFVLGDQISMADLCLVAQMYNMRRFDLPLDGLSLCRKIERSCMAIPAIQRAAPEQQIDAPQDLAPIHGPDAPLLKAA